MPSTCHNSHIMRSGTSFIESSFSAHPRISCQCFYLPTCTLSKISEFTLEGDKWSCWHYLGSFFWLFYYCDKTGIVNLRGDHAPSRRFPRGVSILSACITEVRLPQGARGDRRTPYQGRAVSRGQAGATAALFRAESGTSPSPAPAAGGLSASRAARAAPRRAGTAGPMLQLCPGRRSHTAPGWLALSCGQTSSSDSPGSCHFKGRGRSREAARSFWPPEPAPSAAARPRPLPVGAHGSGRLSADCCTLNLSP